MILQETTCLWLCLTLSATASWFLQLPPTMPAFIRLCMTIITRLAEHNFQNRTVGLIENGSWAPLAAKVMKEMLSKCKKINWLDTTVKILSAVKQENYGSAGSYGRRALSRNILPRMTSLPDKNDMTALIPHRLRPLCRNLKRWQKGQWPDRQHCHTAYRQS